MNVAQEIQKIKEFRKENRGQCVSTSHNFSFCHFMMIIPTIKKVYNTFNVKMEEEQVIITINMFGKKF